MPRPRRKVDPEELSREAALARDALGHLGPEFYDDYDLWVRVGMALCQLGDQGLDIWHEWSARSAKYDANMLDSKWQTFTASHGTEQLWTGGRSRLVGLGSLFKFAEENGWERSSDKQRIKRSGLNSFTISF